MIQTTRSLPSRPTYFFAERNAVLLKAKKIAILAILLMSTSTSAPHAKAGTVLVDIYSTFDVSNAPSGGPYTGFVGQLDLSSDVFTGLGYNFGNPFGLSSFAAVISFTQYMSTTGFYSGGLNSGTAPVLWTKGGAPDPFFGGPWAAGSAYNEVLFNAGYNDFELVFLAGAGFGGGFGGEPFNLSLVYFEPWGGDPRMADGAYSYVTTKEPAEVPDSASTVGLLIGALTGVLALHRRIGRPARG